MALPPRVSRALEVEGAALAAALLACAAARADRPAAAHHAARAALEHACRLLLSAGPVDPGEPFDPRQERTLEELSAELLGRPGLLDPLVARALRAAMPLLEPVEPGTPEGALGPLVDAVERPLTGVIGWMFWSSPAALRLRALPDWPAVGRRLDELRGAAPGAPRAPSRVGPQVAVPVEDLTDPDLPAPPLGPPPSPAPAPALSPAVAEARGEREALQLHRARLAAARVEVQEVLEPPAPAPPARRGSSWALALAAALGGGLSGAVMSRVALEDAAPAPAAEGAPPAADQNTGNPVRAEPGPAPVQTAPVPAITADAPPPAPDPAPAAAPAEGAGDGACPAGMVPVAGGTVRLGQPQGGRGRWPAPDPVEVGPVEVAAFCVDRLPRTWSAVAGQPAARLAESACAKGKSGPARPAVCLSRDEAAAACAAAGARLPSLLEWEQVARVTELSLGPTREWSGERFPPAPLNRRGPTPLGDGMFLQALDAPVPADGNVLWSWNQADPARRLGDLGFRCAADLRGP